MSEAYTFEAVKRELHGKAVTRRMRRLDSQVPAVVYGGEELPMHISLQFKDVVKVFSDPGASAQVMTLNLDGKEHSVVVKAKQIHPAKCTVQHIDFMRVKAGEALQIKVGLRFIGGDVSPGVKLGGGTFSHQINEVEIRCLPKDLPDHIDVDVSNMELNQILHLTELKLPAGVSFAHEIDAEHDQAVVSIHKRGVDSEEAEAGEAGEAGEAAAEGEAEKPAE